MSKFTAYIASFFNPVIITYHLKEGKDVAVPKIEKFIKGDTSSVFRNTKGTFVSYDNFKFWIITMAFTNGVRYSSKFEGSIQNDNSGKIILTARLKPAPILYVFLAFALIFLIAHLVTYFQYKHYSVSDLLSGFIGVLIFGTIPFFIYHISNAWTCERFEAFLRKEN